VHAGTNRQLSTICLGSAGGIVGLLRSALAVPNGGTSRRRTFAFDRVVRAQNLRSDDGSRAQFVLRRHERAAGH